MAQEKLNLDALNELKNKIDSGLAVTNTRIISEEYNTLLDAVKAIGGAVNELIEGGGGGDKIIISTSAVNGRVEPNASVVDKYTTVVLEAFGNAGYHFSKWSDGNTANPRTVVALENATYTAEFEADAVGDVEAIMTTEGVITSLNADNADEIYYSLDGGAPTTKYTSETGYIALQNGEKFGAIGKNSATGAAGVMPIVLATYDAPANQLTITSDYDMTINGESAGKVYAVTMTVASYTIVANGRTSTIQIIND